MSLGSVCRLLLASELQERPPGHPKIATEARGHRKWGRAWAGRGRVSVPAARTHRCVKDLSPLKVNLESAQMSLFSMKLEEIRTVSAAAQDPGAPAPIYFFYTPPRFQPVGLRQAFIPNLETLSLW